MKNAIIALAALTVIGLINPSLLADKPDEKDADKKSQKELDEALKEAESIYTKDQIAAERKKTNESLAGLLMLEAGDEVVLFSLNPKGFLDKKDEQGKTLFHGYEIVTHKKVVKDDDRKELVTSLKALVHWCSFLQAACFNPRHGLRITHGKTVTDYLICFECGRMYVYRDDKHFASFTLFGLKKSEVADRILK